MNLSTKKRRSKLTFYFSLFVLIFSFLSIIILILAETGIISIGLGSFTVSIHSPQNTTYNFSSVSPNYTLQLNVSADRTIDKWWYTLVDLTHNTTLNSSVFFVPNTTINATRFSNKITVFANDSGNNIQNSSVIFFVSVPNSAPIINEITTQHYVCEGNFLFYTFNVIDIDENDVSISTTFTNPFFVTTLPDLNLTLSHFEIFSGILSKSNAGGANIGHKNYSGNISVTDSQYSDSALVNITVIEINNAPTLNTIGVRTIWTAGNNSTFNYQAFATDVESGNSNLGNISFNISFSGTALFGINSSSGVINYTGNSGDLGVHNVTVCATDNGIRNPHQNISLCSQSGGNLSDCETFGLTVTDENRAPNITSYYPTNLTLTINGNDNLYFNITESDLDGTYPDSYWYVDGILREYDNNSIFDEFSYTFGCDVSGVHTVEVISTDGELNDSVQWNFTVDLEQCPVSSVVSSSGSGGSGGVVFCAEKWGCENWNECQNLINSEKDLSADISKSIRERCDLFNFDNRECGFQVRECIDVNRCRTLINKPGIIRECQYTANPSCFDGILNCHDGFCEVLTDCGGGCVACPTCSDNIKNQNEEGIDCGGVCPICVESPSMSISTLLYLLITLFVISLLIISFLTARAYYYYKNRKKEERRRSHLNLSD